MIQKFSTDCPADVIDSQLLNFLSSDEQENVILVSYSHVQSYLPNTPEIKLFALVSFVSENKTANGFKSVETSLSVFLDEVSVSDALNQLEPTHASFLTFCQSHKKPIFERRKPVILQPIDIPKPWGKEVWYTGIEERGQSLVSDGNFSIPLPWLLSVGEKYWLDEKNTSPILLKILDPLPEPVFGDLYFELHEEKREVYIVTNIDKQAWPDSSGGIRFGFDQTKRAAIDNDEQFKAEYLDAVKAYQTVRTLIDAQLDECRRAESIGLNDPVSAETTQRWLEKIDDDLKQKELSCRQTMESFIHVKPLKVGDVIKVPTHTPHSLMHGVRTIEFQTPVYERKILSFAQKVLTQNHWDTESALEISSLDAPVLPELETIELGPENNSHVRVESVVTFDDFEVHRIVFSKSGDCQIPMAGEYRLVIAVNGQLSINQMSLSPEQAMLVSADANILDVSAQSDDAIVLIAKPIAV